jgi:hypothetical protein
MVTIPSTNNSFYGSSQPFVNSVHDITGAYQSTPTSVLLPSHQQLVAAPVDNHFLLINFIDLLRVIRKGPAVRNAVDDAIDLCSSVVNLRESIEEARLRAEQATDERHKRMHTTKALQNLRRYFELIVFQAFLHSTEPDTLQSFKNENIETFVKNRPGKFLELLAFLR